MIQIIKITGKIRYKNKSVLLIAYKLNDLRCKMNIIFAFLIITVCNCNVIYICFYTEIIVPFIKDFSIVRKYVSIHVAGIVDISNFGVR